MKLVEAENAQPIGLGVATIGVDADRKLDPERLKAVFAQFEPGGKLALTPPRPEMLDRIWNIEIAGLGLVMVMENRRPVYEATRDDPLQLSVCRFNDEELAPHEHHFLVTPMARTTGRRANQFAQLLTYTRFVAALAESSDAAAVCWRAADVVHTREHFVEVGGHESPFKLDVWAGVRTFEHDGRVYALSSGMELFGLMDGLVGAPLGEEFAAARCLFDISYKSIELGQKPLGMSFGRAKGEPLRVNVTESPVHDGVDVWMVEL